MSEAAGFDLLTTSARGGIRHYWRDNVDGSASIATYQDVDPILDLNKAMATHNDGYSPSRELRRAASIPMTLIYKWLHEEGWNALNPAHGDRLKKKLNSSEYLYLRTAPGRL
jgi:hypothetical protein